MNNKLWKVPGRSIRCDTFTGMLKYTLWCYIVLKIFPLCYEFESEQELQKFLKGDSHGS